MEDGNLPTIDPTNPEQATHAVQATLEAAERIRRQMLVMRDDHRAWYLKIQDDEQSKIDAIVREAADKLLPEHVAQLASKIIREWVVDDVARRVLDLVMSYADIQEIKRVGKAVRALSSLFKGK